MKRVFYLNFNVSLLWLIKNKKYPPFFLKLGVGYLSLE